MYWYICLSILSFYQSTFLNKDKLEYISNWSSWIFRINLLFEVLNEGHNVIGVDNFCNSTDKNIKLIKKHFPDNFNFYEIDLSECCKGLESYLKEKI